MQCRKNIAVEDNKKQTNITNFTNICVCIYIYIQIYIPILYVPRMTQNKNYSINSILQHDCVVVQTQTVNLYFVCF